ncbi:hypothetical protein AYO41_05160 [Verrucomicrobia bacterium SCGC AG-212-E04]|nr:hypothetical protein AYO41_05160 [Verrucomicrobia bacterium SCGC AG-212-E04]
MEKFHTLRSGNTFGARFWSDGKRIAPMLPERPPFARCHDCHEVYALADAKEIGELPFAPDPIDPEWESAPFVSEPDEAAYYDAIAKSESTDGNYMRTLRILTWWSRNDRYRVGDDAESRADSDDPRWLENAETLLEMPIQDASDQFMKIEILRQLGRHTEALTQLGKIEGCEEIKRALRALCESSDTKVRELRFE